MCANDLLCANGISRKMNGGCETGILGWARSAGPCFFLSLFLVFLLYSAFSSLRFAVVILYF